MVATGLTLFLNVQPGPAEESPSLQTKPGAVCPHLRQVQEHLGDGTQFHASLAAAARLGEQALLGPGTRFGRPERAALELRRVVEDSGSGSPDVGRWLDEGLDACGRLGR